MPVLPHIETSQLICTADQLTGFYMRATLAFNALKAIPLYLSLYDSPSKCLFEKRTLSLNLQNYELITSN